ncbi:hypothetical protein B0H14DRAFT_3501801 [Mycena olivaceomarginata]|nr:hypothetical protein B0H14DRAFT_3501801 [Mycena olivaceomarginata]
MEELPAIVLRWAEGKLSDKDAELGPDTEALPSPCRADFPVLSLSNQAIEEHAAQTEVIQEVGLLSQPDILPTTTPNPDTVGWNAITRVRDNLGTFANVRGRVRGDQEPNR